MERNAQSLIHWNEKQTDVQVFILVLGFIIEGVCVRGTWRSPGKPQLPAYTLNATDMA